MISPSSSGLGFTFDTRDARMIVRGANCLRGNVMQVQNGLGIATGVDANITNGIFGDPNSVHANVVVPYNVSSGWFCVALEDTLIGRPGMFRFQGVCDAYVFTGNAALVGLFGADFAATVPASQFVTAPAGNATRQIGWVIDPIPATGANFLLKVAFCGLYPIGRGN